MKKVNFSLLPIFAALTLGPGPRAATFTGLPGELFVPSAKPLGHLGLIISAGAYGHQDASMVRDNLFLKQNYSGALDSNKVQDFESACLRLNFALGLGRYVDVGLSFPFAGDFITDTEAKELSGGAFGDPLVSLKAGRSFAGVHVFDAALLTEFSVPSKSGKGFLPKEFGMMPDDSIPASPRFISTYGVGWAARALFTLDLTRLEETPLPLRSSLGTGFSRSGLPGAKERFLLGGDAEWAPLPYLTFSIGAQSETRLSRLKGIDAIGAEYSYAFAGFSSKSDDGVFFAVNVQKSLPAHRPFRTYSIPEADGVYAFESRYQPSLALAATIGWRGGFVAEDSDRDGIPDKEDSCPNEKEDPDGFQDADGCPEPDNDLDGIADALDKCPNEPEDKDGFQDEDGCPEPDNDKDGILDAEDKCPSDAEDVDGYEDYDGCPDLDNDKDEVTDAQDHCPNLAEDKDSFEDGDGCPEPDNDQDKIPDINDKCPNEAETFNGFEDGDGCPDTLPEQSQARPLDRRTVLRSAHFLGNTARLMPESYPSLDSLAGRIRALAGTQVEIRGYWDGAATEQEALRASEARASAVRKYLILKGVSADQIRARGLGSRDPIESNHTAAGRRKNRRLEMVLMD